MVFAFFLFVCLFVYLFVCLLLSFFLLSFCCCTCKVADDAISVGVQIGGGAGVTSEPLAHDLAVCKHQLGIGKRGPVHA